MADLKKYTRAEALEICRRMGLAETPLSNENVLIGTNDKGHLYKFPIKTKEDLEKEKAEKEQPKVETPIEEKPVEQPVVEEKKEEVTPPPPVKRKRGRPPKKKKVEK